MVHLTHLLLSFPLVIANFEREARPQKLRLVEGISEEEMNPISMNKGDIAN